MFDFDPADAPTFDHYLKGFVPPDVFDVHAHLYRVQDLGPTPPPIAAGGPEVVDLAAYRHCLRRWLGDAAPTDGLFFPFPTREVDTGDGNQFMIDELADEPGSRWLMLIRPTDDPDAVEASLTPSCAGFKVYHLLSPDREDTFFADNAEFLPDWAWEIANRHGLAIMLHMVKARAVADPLNQAYIREHCLRYPAAKLILAHAARGFCGRHTTEGIHSLRGLDNVYFDMSGICEPEPMEAILKACGVRRFMYASDFPISELRGRPVSFGDGFFWLQKDNADYEAQAALGRPPLVGIESMLALQHACRNLGLTDTDVENIFAHNARDLLGIATRTDGNEGQRLYREAKRILPGGTMLLSKRPELYAPDRWPPYYSEAHGCEVVDIDGRRFLDFSMPGIGSTVLGYADPDVTQAVIRTVTMGSMTTLNPPDEVVLARLLLEIHPWADMARLGRLGGETMAIAVRIARARTGRSKVAICGYHGWHDWYLAANIPAAGDGSVDQLGAGHLLPGLEPTGVPRELGGTTLTFAYNDLDALTAIVAEHGGDLAAIVMEPIRNYEPDPGFLEGVRQLADDSGAQLVFDEITIGWKLCLGGAHMKYGVHPDMAVFAKTLGNGHPIAAVIGVGDTMAAAEDSFISSAFWTEAVGPAAGVATVRKLMRVDVPGHLQNIGGRVRDGLMGIAGAQGVPLSCTGTPAITYFAFDHADALALQTLWTVRMLDRGFLAAGQFAPTYAHEEWQVDRYLAACADVFGELAEAAEKGDAEKRLGTPIKHSGFRRLA